VQIRRFVTAENTDGTAHVQMDVPVPDTDTVGSPAMVLWGWDAMPTLPIGPDQIGPEHTDRALFPPTGGASVNLVVFPPAGEEMGSAAEEDVANAGMVNEGGGNMHRTDTIDFLFVLEGEVVLLHPGADELTLRAGDFFVQNGAIHEWQNRRPEPCVMACLVLSTPRES
jgi:hypothetical protein